MSQDIPGLVETSSNLASIKQRDGKLVVVTSQRSSILSSRKDMSQMVSSAFLLGGAEVTTGDGYPGWKPNPSSEILQVSVESYKRLFATEPKIKAIHAGLECGLFLEKYPSLDMVSFGPTLRGVHSPTNVCLSLQSISSGVIYWMSWLIFLQRHNEIIS